LFLYQIIALAEKDPAVLKTLRIVSTYQSPEEVVLMLVIAFTADLDTADINEAITHIRESVKTAFPLVKYVIVQPEF